MVEVSHYSTQNILRQPEIPSQSQIHIEKLKLKHQEKRQIPFSANIKTLLGGETEQKGVDDILEMNRAFLIRHANTLQNSRVEALVNRRDTNLGDWIDVQGDPSLIDTELSQEGLRQCQLVSHALSNHRIDTIFVSPMLRTLQTAYHLFHKHPNFDRMTFVLHPHLREKLHVSADLMHTYDLNILEERARNLGLPHIQIQPLVEEHWFSAYLPPELSLDASSLNTKIISAIHDQYPKTIESLLSVKKRSLIVEKDVKDYMRAHPKHKVAVIGHSMMFRIMTASEKFWERREKDPTDVLGPEVGECLNLKNCEIQPWFKDVYDKE